MTLDRLTRQQMSRIRHRHLTCFLEIARSRTISLAAKSLNVTQPAASKTLNELEEILGAKLILRGGKGGLKLTEEGTTFLQYAGASLTALREGLHGLAQIRQQMTPLLSIGALPTVAANVMPDVIKKFRELSSARVRVITAPNALMLDQLRLGDLDLVVGRLTRPEMMHGLSFTHLYSEPLVFAVRPGHPLDGKVDFNLSQLSKETLLMPTDDGIVRPVIDRFLIASGIGAVPNAIEARSPDFCRQFAIESDAIWIISRGVIENDLRLGTLRTLNIDTTDTRGAVGLTVRDDLKPSPTMQQLINTVASVAAGHEVD